MALTKTGKAIAIASAAVSFVSFAYKLSLGIITTSMVLIIASISTLMVFLVKLFFVKNANADKATKKKAYLIMTILLFVYALIFILFTVLKVAGIDTSNQKTYSGWIGALFILFILVMFVLSVIKLRGALEKNDLMVIGLKEMTFVSALTDVIIIIEFISRIILEYKNVPELYLVNGYVPLAVGAIMIITAVKMLTRYKEYEAK